MRAAARLTPATTLDELGLSSLERVELMVALEDAFGTRIDENAFTEARDLSALRTVIERGGSVGAAAAEPVEFPTWNRTLPARAIRRASLPTWILPIARLFAWIRVEGREHLERIQRTGDLRGQSPEPHGHAGDLRGAARALPLSRRPGHGQGILQSAFLPGAILTRRAWLTNSLNYYLAALFFNAFPLPQREAGARQTLQYIGEVLDSGFSVLIFPEGRRTQAGEIDRFRPGIGMIGARLDVPVVPVRIDGLDKVLHSTWKMARPGRVRVAFGAPLRLAGDDYEALAAQVENAVRAL